jgi:HK97 family phage prohead protease
MSKQIERRVLKGTEIRAKQGDKPGIEGVGAVFNQQYDNGWFIETMKPGAFDRAISEAQDVRCLFNHDPNNVLARTKSGTLRLAIASDGLHFDCDTDSTGIASDVRAMIARGDVDGCSISFIVRKDTWSDEFDAKGDYVQSTRTIEDVDLFDVGPVTFPAYTQTSVGARSMWPDGIPAEVRSHVPGLREGAPKPALVKPARRDAKDGDCTCSCDPCQDGNCADCSCSSDCDASNCANEDCSCGAGERMRKRLRIAEASL